MNKNFINKHTIFLGLNDKNTKQQEINTLDAFKIVQNLIADRFGGGTIKEASGIYKHDDGAVVIEKCLEITLLFCQDDEIKKFCQELKTLFNQESVALQKDIINSELV